MSHGGPLLWLGEHWWPVRGRGGWSWGLGGCLSLDITGGAGDDPEPLGGKCGIFALRFEPAVEPQEMLKPGVSPTSRSMSAQCARTLVWTVG